MIDVKKPVLMCLTAITATASKVCVARLSLSVAVTRFDDKNKLQKH